MLYLFYMDKNPSHRFCNWLKGKGRRIKWNEESGLPD